MPETLPEPQTWRVGPSTFTAFPAQGARLASWTLSLAGGRVRPVLYWPAGRGDTPLAKVRGGNPILFPFAAHSFHQGREDRWKAPDGEVRPMPRHGFARQGRFVVETHDERGFTARLDPTDEDRQAYPFAFTFRVCYAFHELGLTATLRLANDGDTRIPWCPGHHFYFALPWHEGLTRDDYRLVLPPARKAWQVTAEGKLAPADKPAPEEALGDRRLIDRLHTHLKGNEVRFGPRGGEEDIVIRLGEAPVPPTWTTLVTWTEAADSPFYCVEPWYGPPNSVALDKGVGWVDPGAQAAWAVSVELA